MKFRPSIGSLVLLQGLGCVAAACGGEAPAADENEVGEVEQSIATERPNGEAEVWGRRIGQDPQRDRALMATAGFKGGCGATMIGPHIAMTAAHCGPETGKIDFFIYDDPFNRTKVRTEQFDCTGILNTYPETDLALLFCESNFWGEAPGDKYGYLDFELWHGAAAPFNVDYINSRNLNLALDQKRYSGWMHPIVSLGGAQHLIYSEGFLGVNDRYSIWFSPTAIKTGQPDMGQCSTTDDIPNAAEFKMWSAKGASGSAVISNVSHRLVSGPISTTPFDTGQEGWNRYTMPIADYLAYGVIQTPNGKACGMNLPNMINGSFLARFGVTPPPAGSVDQNQNGVFDVQERVERAMGEHVMRTHFMNFDSERQNALWDLSGGAIVPRTVTTSGRLLVQGGSGGFTRKARHPRLGLESGVSYHVDFKVLSDRPYRVCIGSRCIERGSSNGAWVRTGDMLTADAGTALEIWTSGAGNTTIEEIAVVQDAFHDMQSAPQRAVWRDVSGKRGTSDVPAFVPYGPFPIGDADYSAVVLGTTTPKYGLESTSMPFRTANANNSLCVDVQMAFSESASTIPFFVSVQAKGQAAREFQFTVNTSWAEYCTPDFTLPNADVTLRFGARSEVRVDNVVVFH